MADVPQKAVRHLHFIGIGGIGMSGIAKLFLTKGAVVSGSDIKDSSSIDELRRAGAKVFIGHHAANIKGADEVVFSSAIREDNPELKAARQSGRPVIKRAQALAELMEGRSTIAVAGSHGKTTTTSLISYVLLEAGMCPTAAIGGVLRNIDTNACAGEGRFFVAEADESDGSFLYYAPAYTVITNIDREHLDYYGTFEAEVAAFKKFIERMRSDGCLICCNDDESLRTLARESRRRSVRYGLNCGADLHAANIVFDGLRSSFDCYRGKEFVGRFDLSLAGSHNVSNCLAVIALALELGITTATLVHALATYQGTGRRIEVKFSDRRYTVLDDYAHHPTEIRATLAAVRPIAKERLIVVFQPHRYTRTKLLFDDFASCFEAADYLVITDIYPASEQPIEGIDGRRLAERVQEALPGRRVVYLPKSDIAGHVTAMVAPGDVVVTLGAGDITKVSDELAESIKRKS